LASSQEGVDQNLIDRLFLSFLLFSLPYIPFVLLVVTGRTAGSARVASFLPRRLPGMEGDQTNNNPTCRAVGQTEHPPTGEIVGPPAQTDVKDFSAAPPSQDQDDAVRGEKGSHGLDQGGIGQDAAAAAPEDDPLGPGFVDVDGDVGGSGHNETVVDIIAVPCPGADPIQTWTYDQEFYGEPGPCEIGSHISPRSSLRRPSPWVTGKLRNSASIARVLLYKHRQLEEGMTLGSLSKDLLGQVERIRRGAVGVLPPSSLSRHADSLPAITPPVFYRP
jgi:hypothetical protein